ncbi:MAG: hypothetical protein WBW79_05525 [Desulfocapsaceae bacterium]
MKSSQKALKKLSFSLQVEPKPAHIGSAAGPATFSCIYGIGLDGLSRFESEVSGLEEGSSIRLDLKPGGAPAYFGHLYRSLCDIIQALPTESLRLRITLTDISDPAPSEVVSSIAALQKEHGCSGSCGCGCGD